jgi:hypothetical protein
MKYVVRLAGAGAAAEGRLARSERHVDLYARPGGRQTLTAGAAILREVRGAHLAPSVRAWDFLSIALAAMVAVSATLRRDSPDGWTREISLDLALTEPEVWLAHLPRLISALEFLTTDIWKIDVTERAAAPFRAPKSATAPEADCVALLSGGLDSLSDRSG